MFIYVQIKRYWNKILLIHHHVIFKSIPEFEIWIIMQLCVCSKWCNEVIQERWHAYMPLWSRCDPPLRRHEAPESPQSRRCTSSLRLRRRPGRSPPLCAAWEENRTMTPSVWASCSQQTWESCVLMLGQQPGAGNVKHSDGSGAEAAGEGRLVWMKRHGARLVHRHEIIQLQDEKHTEPSWCRGGRWPVCFLERLG